MESGEEMMEPHKVSLIDLLVNDSFKLGRHGQHFVSKTDKTGDYPSVRKLIKISKEPIVFDGEPCEIIFVTDQTSDLHLFDKDRHGEKESAVNTKFLNNEKRLFHKIATTAGSLLESFPELQH